MNNICDITIISSIIYSILCFSPLLVLRRLSLGTVYLAEQIELLVQWGTNLH